MNQYGLITFIMTISLLTNLFADNSKKGCPLEEGDIIFQESFSKQAPFIKLATDSSWSHVGIVMKERNKWVVYEAIQPTSKTPLYSFVFRYPNNPVVEVKRLQENAKLTFENNKDVVRKYLKKQVSRRVPYDLLFEWGDNKLYCSEYVYKALRQIGLRVGEIELIKDLPGYSDPKVLALAKYRWNKLKKTTFDIKEWEVERILTPESMFRFPDAKCVFTNSKSKSASNECIVQNTRSKSSLIKLSPCYK
ncbi:YiiX/YebB-like N1pC/P60 family cysteine hydrolase [Bacteriovoracaceae bacterium]|nr:YiiX/YebB-like N1pC/P60 family cysteine hydrolase [Bacteriovoracaceae bacterium]